MAAVELGPADAAGPQPRAALAPSQDGSGEQRRDRAPDRRLPAARLRATRDRRCFRRGRRTVPWPNSGGGSRSWAPCRSMDRSRAGAARTGRHTGGTRSANGGAGSLRGLYGICTALTRIERLEGASATLKLTVQGPRTLDFIGPQSALSTPHNPKTVPGGTGARIRQRIREARREACPDTVRGGPGRAEERRHEKAAGRFG
jgi:hypothetical protein